ncbi:MAG TPA: DUF3089 domain-containing protein [Parvularculaceae bacterium]|nr:DUF3089 domain-containing protein [Parvularculaceae bacterium]
MAILTWKRAGYGAIGLFGLVLIASIIVFQDGIVRFFATPRAPFQTVTPPPQPEYAARGAWLLWPDGPGRREADAFYVHSTTYYRRRSWNAPINDEDAERVRRMIAAPNEAGPFNAVANMYGPRYREATLFSLFTHKYDGIAARRLAYADVSRAFKSFLKERDRNSPIVLVGYGQGGLHVLGLLREYFQGEFNPLRRHLVAAYVIGASTPAEFLATINPPLPVCDAPDDVRCLISYVDYEPRFDEEMERVRARSLAWDDGAALISFKSADIVCVNPLSWRRNADYAPADDNVGAASATGIAYGAMPPPIARAVGARCDRGILVVDTPRRGILRRGDWFGDKWKAQPFNLFYYDLAENAALRLAALKERLKVEPEPLEPIGETIDLEVTPVGKVSN